MKKFIKIGIIGVIGIAILLGVLVYRGVLTFSLPLLLKYPVKGVDVSHYQGDINWQVLSGENIKFAIIKATEGSSHEDENFAYNYEEAKKTSLYIGAYHFFSFDSPGRKQAENYIKAVPKDEDNLPPVIDFEFYGDKKQYPPQKEEVLKELGEMLISLESYYGKKPIIYVTQATYEQYIKGTYDSYPIWMRSLLIEPNMQWTIWQYANWGFLKGYEGAERRIDLNVFNGSIEEFEQFIQGE